MARFRVQVDAASQHGSSWWYVDLGRSLPVEYVHLYLPTRELLAQWLGDKLVDVPGLEVRVGDVEPGSPGDVGDTRAAGNSSSNSSGATAGGGAANPVCATGVPAMAAGASPGPTVVDCGGMAGRFVVVRLAQAGQLALCEVKVRQGGNRCFKLLTTCSCCGKRYEGVIVHRS